MGHAKWFATMDALPFWTATAWCARAALWDVAMSGTAYAAAALAVRRPQWIHERRPLALIVYVVVGLGITIAVERSALATGRWHYAPDMPTLGGIGFTPLLQWIIVPLLFVAISRAIIPHSRSRA
jgi:L-cystine uptake protein TcyP (sodium:dicarboxylate symporter family)